MLARVIYKLLTLISTLSLVLLCIFFFFFLNILKFQKLFQELLNQHQASLYLFECISHIDFKYGHEIQQYVVNSS